ncbi:MAG: hypothetical protein WAQ53_12105 [Thiofilum sp.]|uniref:hypothetical protein n=1 Tax=Thiofilum sp. TaxID=2212733 RepID=UPI0025FE4EB3|nr:hypothetical protein [Thiofilum sp.]MBK8454261.1 hypothetical protein [Thiofilum sp.]
MKEIIAFDLDETLGTIITDGLSIIGFNMRVGSVDLLSNLKKRYILALWTVSSRAYTEKALGYGLRDFFDVIYTWDEISESWKDIRRINAKYLIDDSAFHQEEAKKYNLHSRYIIIPSYGSPEDIKDELLWVSQVREIIN